MTEPRRDRWGRYIIPDPKTGEDREWTRATTIAGVLPDRYHLERWGERMVVLGIARDESLYVLAQTSKYEDKQQLDRIARDAKSAAKSGSAANVGTAIHKFTEMVEDGYSIDVVPQRYRADVAAYLDALKQLDATVLSKEQIVLNPAVGVAGTYDRKLAIPRFSKSPIIGDIKTGRTVDFGLLEFSVQLAIYANSEYRFDVDTGEVEDIGGKDTPDREVGLLFHIQAGKGRCEVWELDLVRGWEAAKVALQVREMRSWKDLGKKIEITQPEEEE